MPSRLICLTLLALAAPAFAQPASDALQRAPATSHIDARIPPELPRQAKARIDLMRSFHPYAVCVVTDTGRLACADSHSLLPQAPKTMTPHDIALVKGAMDRIAAQAGFDSPSDILVHCAGQWRAAQIPNLVNANGARLPGQQGGRATLEALQFRTVRSALASTCVKQTGRTTLYRQQGAQTVSGLHEKPRHCRDSGSGLLAHPDKEPGNLQDTPKERAGKAALSQLLITLAEDALKAREQPALEQLAAEIEAGEKAQAELEQQYKQQALEGRASTEDERDAQQCL